MNLPSVRILVGDALEQLRALPDESVHCVVTSPPYWGLRDYGVAGQIGLEDTFEEFLDRLIAVFAEVRRVLKKRGTIWVNMGDSYASNSYGGSPGAVNLEGGRGNLEASRAARTKARVPTNCKPKDLIGQPWALAFALRAQGWFWRSTVIWHKPAPMPESVKDRPTKSWEPVLLFSKSRHYHYDRAAIMEPCVASESNTPDDWERAVNRRRRTTATLRQGSYKAASRTEQQLRPSFGREPGWRDREQASKNHTPRPGIDTKGGGQGSGRMTYPTDLRNKRDVWTIPSRPFDGAHFATFPPDLVEPCILAGCRVGGTVLDPFFGAGTTGLVAAALGRNCVGIELSPSYAEMAERRIHAEGGLLCRIKREVLTA